MWLWMAIGSAVLLGFYDVAKKKALSHNSVLYVLLAATALSTIFLSPFLIKFQGCTMDHICLIMKAMLVTASWVSGMVALKMLPITTVSTLKATRPFLVVVFSIILFEERLNLWQWGGVVLALAGVTLLSRSSSKEGIAFARNKGVWAMGLSIVAGVASALYDKYILKGMGMAPLFVQSWSNLYITLMLVICIVFKKRYDKVWIRSFRWDWTLLAIAILITSADALYFFSIKQDGALLSVISLARRSSVIVTFFTGAILFKEKNVARKSFDLAFILAGMVLLLIGS